jgi:hypothetical protein
MKSMRVDHTAANGRPSPGKGNFKPAASASTHIPEQGKKATPKGQWTANKEGQGESLPKFGMSKGSGHLAKGGEMHEQPTKGHSVGNHPKGSVPTGEHHAAHHRAPTSHEEFHKLGSGHWKP